jgi:FtsZ-binding cell division protein ZapB
MGDTTLIGVLRMPPDLWRGDEMDVRQRFDRYLQAADTITTLRAEVERLNRQAAYWEAIARKGEKREEALEAEIADRYAEVRALREDAERMTFLTFHRHDTLDGEIVRNWIEKRALRMTFRGAIDAARSAALTGEPGPGGEG